MMSVELMAIFGTGIALAGLIIVSNRGLRFEIAGLRGAIAGLREDLKQISDRVARIEHSQAHLEGFLEGLREAIVAAARENPNPSDGS